MARHLLVLLCRWDFARLTGAGFRSHGSKTGVFGHAEQRDDQGNQSDWVTPRSSFEVLFYS
jgi:hypothetical protein